VEHFCDWKSEESTMCENTLSFGRNIPPSFVSEFESVVAAFAEHADPDGGAFESWFGSLFAALESLFAKMRMSFRCFSLFRACRTDTLFFARYSRE